MPKIVDHKERRLAFAEAAFRVIATSGLGGTTMRGVAQEAGYTTGALVHYFPSKDDLLLEASERSARIMRERLDESARQRAGLDALRHFVYGVLPATPEMRGIWNVWLGFWDRATSNQKVKKTTALRYKEWQQRIIKLIAAAQAAGELSPGIDPAIAADCIISLVDGIGVRLLLTRGAMPAERQKKLVDALIDNLPQTAHKTHKRRPQRGRRSTS